MVAIVDLSQDAIQSAVRAFLIDVIGTSIEIVSAQDNFVAAPRGPNYITITPGSRTRLGTNRIEYDDPGTNPGSKRIIEPSEVSIQIDVYGPTSEANAQIITSTFRDLYATEFFTNLNVNIRPLYCDDPKQIPFVDESQQFEERWTFTLNVQANAITTVPQDFAATVTLRGGIITVDSEGV